MKPNQELVTFTRVAGGRYVLAGAPTPVELRLSRWRSRGSALIGTQSFELRRTGVIDRGVAVVGADDTEVLQLSRRHPRVPGLDQCDWRVRARLRGYEGRLSAPGSAELTVRTGHGGRSDVTAELTGSLPNRDLVLLAAAFAVLMRRREDTEAAGASVAAVATTS